VETAAHDVTPPDVADVLTAAGFQWREPGYWSVVTIAGELTLEPQVLNAGAWKLGLYFDEVQCLPAEVLVDVRPRPRGRSAAGDVV
jgi:hypothetical protein